MCIGLHRKFLTYFWHCYVGGSDFCLSTARGILCFLFPGYFNPYLSLIAGHGGSPCWHTACSLRTGPISEDAHVAARRILTQTPGRWVPPPAGRPRAGPSLPPALPGAGAAAPAEPPWSAAPPPAPRSLCWGERPRRRRAPRVTQPHRAAAPAQGQPPPRRESAPSAGPRVQQGGEGAHGRAAAVLCGPGWYGTRLKGKKGAPFSSGWPYCRPSMETSLQVQEYYCGRTCKTRKTRRPSTWDAALLIYTFLWEMTTLSTERWPAGVGEEVPAKSPRVVEDWLGLCTEGCPCEQRSDYCLTHGVYFKQCHTWHGNIRARCVPAWGHGCADRYVSAQDARVKPATVAPPVLPARTKGTELWPCQETPRRQTVTFASYSETVSPAPMATD